VASARVELTCVDSSTAMLDVLRRKLESRNLSAEVVVQDVTRLDLPSRFALAFIAFHSFEEIIEDADRHRLLGRVLAHLLPGGRFVCTLHDPWTRLRDVGPGRDRQWRFEDPELRLSLSTTVEEGTFLIRGRERIEDVETGEILMDLALCFRLTSREEFQDLVEHAGFSVEALYGDYDGGPYRPGRSTGTVWVLARPTS
jgi:SAM-dependent methyltransferase